MKRTQQPAAVPDSLARGRGRPARTPAGGVFALQRSVGNRAVAGLLQRDTKEKTDQRVVVIPGIGTIPIESFHLPLTRPGSTTSGGKDASPKDVVFSSKQGAHSTMLLRSSLWGEGKDVEVIVTTRNGTMRIKLSKALVSSYSIGGSGGTGDAPLETWTLTAESITFVTPDAEKALDDKVKD